VNTTIDTAVWIDADYDRERASNGVSRYGAYIKQNLSDFAECWDGSLEAGLPVHLAVQAWRVATSPIMAPSYVRYHRRVLGIRLQCSYWDYSLLAYADLVSPWPQPLRQSRRWMEQTGRGWWRDWPIEFGDTYCEPSDEDLTKAPSVLATASLRFTVPSDQFPAPPAAQPNGGTPDLAELVAVAQASVAASARELNRVVCPVIQQLDNS
jgi:hypothetical protein